MNKIGTISEHLIVDSHNSTSINAYSCGYHEVQESHHDIERPGGRNDYQLIYIIKGAGHFKVNGEDIIASPGTLIIYPPQTPQFYYFLGEEDTCYYSVSFIGAHNHLCLVPIFENGPNLFNIGYNKIIVHGLDAIIEEFIGKGEYHPEICNSYLYNILLMTLRHKDQETKAKASLEPAIQETANHMRSSYAKKYTLQDYAAHANLSVSRFIHNFESVYSVSPMKYLTKVRMENACWLLMNTQMPIAGIARFVGYDDPLYFSRVFHKEHNVSPTQFRRDTFPTL